jgi:acetoin utilization deacetylase AcuC-like enzyme
MYTFSIHGQKNFPYDKELSDLDVALPDGCSDAEYLAALDATLPRALFEAQADLAIYIAGADPFQEDRLGRMKLTKDALLERDRRVLSAVLRLGLPTAIVMGGGYAKDVQDVVDIHSRTIALAVQLSS